MLLLKNCLNNYIPQQTKNQSLTRVLPTRFSMKKHKGTKHIQDYQ